MTTITEEPPASPAPAMPQLRSVEVAKRQETRDAWELADAIYEDVLSLVPDPALVATGADGVNTKVYEAAEQVFEGHRKAGTDVGRTYVRAMFATVRVWPREDRLPELASFVVHAELRGKDWSNRREIIQRLARESKNGRATWVNVRLWKSERKPAAFKTFLQLTDERIRRCVKNAGKPWHLLEDGDREEIAKMLHTIAGEVEAGTFGVQT
jgi:hypothetical protein